MKAFVTVSSDEYLAGTLVLIQSLLDTNPWFEGDMVVIDGGLSPKAKHRLIGLYNVKIHAVGDRLYEKVMTLVKALPSISNRYKRFWSLETFQLDMYDQVLFLDSDTIVVKSLKTLFDESPSFGACPDFSSVRGLKRDRKSFEKVKDAEKTDCFDRVFNSGVWFYTSKKLKENIYSEIIDLVTPSSYRHVLSGHTDQYVLNLYFEHNVKWLSEIYNQFVKRTTDEHLEEHDACIWHFIRHPKPWRWKGLLKLKRKEPLGEIIRYWHRVYRQILMVEIRRGNFRALLRLMLSKSLAP